MTPTEIQSVMYSTIQPHNVVQAVLQQEVLLYCGRLIGRNPEMFKGILKIRIGYRIIICIPMIISLTFFQCSQKGNIFTFKRPLYPQVGVRSNKALLRDIC